MKKITKADVLRMLNRHAQQAPVEPKDENGIPTIISEYVKAVRVNADDIEVVEETPVEEIAVAEEAPVEETQAPKTTKKKSTKKTQAEETPTEETPADTESEPVE